MTKHYYIITNYNIIDQNLIIIYLINFLIFIHKIIIMNLFIQNLNYYFLYFIIFLNLNHL